MEFRPCIDIHNGKVKQIVGGSLQDENDRAVDNFVSEQDGAFYADFYQKKGCRGGHVILLNPVDSPYYEATKAQALWPFQNIPAGCSWEAALPRTTPLHFLKRELLT